MTRADELAIGDEIVINPDRPSRTVLVTGQRINRNGTVTIFRGRSVPLRVARAHPFEVIACRDDHRAEELGWTD